MAQYTPGPWRLSGKATIRAGRDSWIADVNWTNREANARLIVAAPDMLEALIAFANLPEDEPPPGVTVSAWGLAIQRAREVTARATGR